MALWDLFKWNKKQEPAKFIPVNKAVEIANGNENKYERVNCPRCAHHRARIKGEKYKCTRCGYKWEINRQQ